MMLFCFIRFVIYMLKIKKRICKLEIKYNLI